MSQMTKPAIRNAVTKAATGARALTNGETVVRGVSSNRMGRPLRLRHTQHFEADGFPGPLGNRLERAQPALMDDRHTVGDLEEFVEILTDHHDRAALAGEIHQGLADQACSP